MSEWLRVFKRMLLPLLPLCPTAGTNDDEAGPSRPPPSAAATAAVHEAFGDGEHAIVKSILNQLVANAPPGLDATEEVCHAVMNFLIANGLQDAIGGDDAIWGTLVRRLFTNAPQPENTSWMAQRWPSPMPANDREYFFELCRRSRNARLAHEKHARLKEQLIQHNRERERLYEAMDAWHAAHRNLKYQDWIKMPGYRRRFKILEQHAWRGRQLEQELETFEDTELFVAEAKLRQWNVGNHAPPRLRRQYTMVMTPGDYYPQPTPGPYGIPPGDPYPEFTNSENEEEDDPEGAGPSNLFGGDLDG